MNDQPARHRTAVLAGLTTAAVVVPQSMAYASLAGLPVQVGLYTAFVPMLVYAALGTSRPLSVSTTSTIAALVGAAIISAQPASAADAIVVASTLALLSGAVLAVAGLLRLGFVADFISLPVLTGYKAGVGLVIIAAQLGKLLGVAVEGEHVGAQVWSPLSQLGDAQRATVLMSFACIAALVVLKRYAPPAVPGPLVVVAVAVAVTALADLAAERLAVVGSVPGGLPRAQPPDLSLVELLLPSAAGIALMAFVESNAAGRAFTLPGEREPNADRELLALGATPDIDVTALAVMEGLAADLEKLGVALRVARPHEGIRALMGSVSADPAWRDRVFPTITAALED